MPWAASVTDAHTHSRKTHFKAALASHSGPRYHLPQLAEAFETPVESSDISMRRLSESDRGLGYPIPPKEEERLATINALELESFKDNATLKSLCCLLAESLRVPLAGINLITEDRVECIATSGPDVGASREDSFCAWTLSPKSPEVLVVEDATKDARFAEKAHVKGAPGVRYYAAAPLVAANGQRVGVMCVMDMRPRQKTAEEYGILCNLAELAMRELEAPNFPKLKMEVGAKVHRTVSAYTEGVMLCEVASRWWDMKFVNPPALAKASALRASNTHFWSVFQPADGGAKNMAQKLAQAEIEQGNHFTLQVKLREGRVTQKEPITIHFRPALQSCLTSSPTGIPNIVTSTDPAQVQHTFYFAVIKEGRSSEESNTQAPLGSPQTFLSREFRSTRAEPDTSGMRDVVLGVVSSSSPSSRIYRATWDKRTVSVKCIVERISQCVQSKEYGTAWIPKEAALSAELMHPNVIKTYKIVVEPKIASKDMFNVKRGEEVVEAWIVREWCGKGDLHSLAHQVSLYNGHGTPNLGLVLEVAQEIASGMAYLHQHNIIHNYLRPSSIVMGEDTHGKSSCKNFAAKITSFSHAVVSAAPVPCPDLQHDITFFPYAAPELFVKGSSISKASDVYSYGKVLWELYSHDLVPMALDQNRIKRRAAGKNELPPFPAEMPKALETLIRDCLATKPSQRPQFTEIKERLKRMIQAEANGQELTDGPPAGDLSRHAFKRSSTMTSRSRRSLEEVKASVASLFKQPSSQLSSPWVSPPQRVPQNKLSFKDDFVVTPRGSSPVASKKKLTFSLEDRLPTDRLWTQSSNGSLGKASANGSPTGSSAQLHSREAKPPHKSSASILSKKLRSMMSFQAPQLRADS